MSASTLVEASDGLKAVAVIAVVGGIGFIIYEVFYSDLFSTGIFGKGGIMDSSETIFGQKTDGGVVGTVERFSPAYWIYAWARGKKPLTAEERKARNAAIDQFEKATDAKTDEIQTTASKTCKGKTFQEFYDCKVSGAMNACNSLQGIVAQSRCKSTIASNTVTNRAKWLAEFQAAKKQ